MDNPANWYDTGASLLEDIINTKPADVDALMASTYIDGATTVEAKLKEMIFVIGEKITVRPILKPQEIIEARKVVRQVYLDEKIEQYIADIVFATRYPEKYNLKVLEDCAQAHGATYKGKIIGSFAIRINRVMNH